MKNTEWQQLQHYGSLDSLSFASGSPATVVAATGLVPSDPFAGSVTGVVDEAGVTSTCSPFLASPAVPAPVDLVIAAFGVGVGVVFGFLGGTTTPGNSLRFLPALPVAGFATAGFAEPNTPAVAREGEVELEARGGEAEADTRPGRSEGEEPARMGGGGAAERFVTALSTPAESLAQGSFLSACCDSWCAGFLSA